MAAQEPVTLALTETGEKISKPLDGKPDSYGKRYFKYVTNEAGEETQVEITRGEFKKDRKLHVTVRHGELPRCGHKLVLGTEPRHRNCEVCWFTFFQLHGELVQSLDEAYARHGKAGLLQLRGQKFVANFLRFMGTVAQWKKEIDATQKDAGVNNGEANSTTESN